VGHPLQVHQPLGHQGGHTRAQQLIEDLARVHPKIGQRVIVHRHAPADPPVRIVFLAQPRHRPRAAHALERRVQPQRHENRRVDRRATGVPLHGLDLGIEWPQVQPLDELPDHAGAVLGGQQPLQVRRAQFQLLAIRPQHAGRRAPRVATPWRRFR